MKIAQLERMQIRELEELKVRIDKVIASKQVSEREAVRARIMALAEKSGFSLGDIVRGGGARASKGRKVPIKFRNPNNYAEVWSGRGRMPRWMTAKVKSGAKVDDFRI